MRRIAVISAAYPPHQSPEADHAMHLCARLAELGMRVDVLTTKGNIPRSPASGVTVHDLMRSWGWREALRILRWLRDVKPDAVLLAYLGWIYDHGQMITLSPLLAKLALPHHRFITQFHNVLGAKSGGTRVSRWIGRVLITLSGGDAEFGALLRWSDEVVIFSEHHLAKLEALCPGVGARSVLIPPPPILRMASPARRDDVRRRLGLGSTQRLIGFFGYIYPGKGVETLIQAFDLLCKRRSDCRLIFIGRLSEESYAGGPYGQHIKALVAGVSSSSYISFSGSYDADSDDGSAYLRALDVCVLPFEQGIQLNNSSFAGAVAHGLPVITTRHPALERAFVDGENVRLCQPKDPAAMADAIMGLVDNPPLAARLAEGARVLAREWFSWESAISKTVAALSGTSA